MAEADAHEVVALLRDQMAAEYGRLSIELAIVRAENLSLRREIARLTPEGPTDA